MQNLLDRMKWGEKTEMNRRTILIVDDEEMSRELLRQMFEDDYNILMAEDGKDAIMEISRHIDEIAIILLDLVMPVLSGYQVLQVLNAKKIVDKIPVVLITAQKDTKVELSCYALGASAVLAKPYVAQVVRMQVSSIIEMHKKAEKLEDKIEGYKEELHLQQRKLEEFYDRLLDAISNVVEFRDLETGNHIRKVKGLTRIMAQAYMELYPEEGLTKSKIDTIVRASAVHDIGKIAIPDNVLLKPGRLTDDEREVMMTHTTRGCEILGLLKDIQDEEQYKASYEICRYHHERHDGKGYPDGLKGDKIPISARLVSIADVYDALVSKRVYKKPYDKETAYRMIVEGQCGVFSPELLDCLEYSKNAIEAFSDSL